MLKIYSGQTGGREGTQCYPKNHNEEKKKKSSIHSCAVAMLWLLIRYIFMLPEFLGTPADPACIMIAPVTTSTQMSSHMQGARQSNGQAQKPSILQT